MSSSEASIFDRDRISVGLSQRFMNNCHEFYGSLNVAIHMLLANTILQDLPRPLGYILLFFYLFTTLTLFFLISKDLWSRHRNRNGVVAVYEDLDLVDLFTTKQDYLLGSFICGFLFILLCVSLFLVFSKSIDEYILKAISVLFICFLMLSYRRRAK